MKPNVMLLSPSFMPLFLVQFLGALNDNIFKNALVVWFTFKLVQSQAQSGLLVTLAAGLFILPFVLFSPYAGRLADSHDKLALIRKIKLAEVGIMGLGAMALLSQSVELMLAALFFMGVQSAFFGPIKYSILPQLFTGRWLIKANGWFSGSTFIAILLGTILGGLGIMLPAGEKIMAVVVVMTAILGWLASLSLKADLPEPQAIAPQTFKGLIQQARSVPLAFHSVLAISWFWFFGAVILSQIPTLVKFQIGGDDTVVVLLLTLFSVGIAVGSLGVAKVLQTRVHLNHHAMFLLGMGVSLAVSVGLIAGWAQPTLAVLSAVDLLSHWPLNLLLLSFFVMAVFGGAYSVPLYTLVQTQTPEPQRARMIAVNNLMNALLMVLSALLIMLGYAVGMGLLAMLSLLAMLNFGVALWIQKLARRLNQQQATVSTQQSGGN